jgi:DNA-binding winged helix-turn-helix (wHTH) protein/tetratricopeptide (TPR) repeat protein
MKRFHSFRLDSVNQCLWRGELRVPITPKAFDVLRYLVEHAGRLVTQDEILDALWPEVHVNHEVVKKYVLTIRKALGDRPDESIFIETIPRRGYQFVAPVIDETAVAVSPTPHPTGQVVGREMELTALQRALDDALRGRRQVVFVTGEAGIGKTTLVDVFHQRAAVRPGVRVARGQCVEGFGGKEAYYPVLEALGQLTREANDSPIVDTLAARAPTWLIQLPSMVNAQQRAQLQRDLVGATRERMVREICEALEALTAPRPLVLIFEDLHWVDPSTLDVISALARRREAAKLMLIATYRPGDIALSESPLKGLAQDLHVHRLCEEIALGPLVESEVAQYLAGESSGHTIPNELARLIYRHSGGNALFMTAILQDLIDKGAIVPDGAGWRLAGRVDGIDPGVPETLQHMLEVQLDGLTAIEQRILKSASVAGDRFSIGAIACTLDLGSERIEELCEHLARRQQLIRSIQVIGSERLVDGDESAHYEFRHSLYREVIYRGLSEVGRSRLHRELGQQLASMCTSARREHELASGLALHFERGRDYERAIRYLVLAAENAGVRFAHRDAIQLLRQALDLVPRIAPSAGAELEIQLLERIGDAHYALGGMAGSAEAYAAAAARSAEAGLGAARVGALTSLMRPLGLIDPDQGIAAVSEAAQLSASLGDPLLVARTEMLAASTRLLYDTWRKADADLCASAHQRVRDLGGESDTPPYHRMIHAYVQVLRGRSQEAFEVFDTFIPKLDESGSSMAYHFALGGKMFALLQMGRFGEVLRIAREGREKAEKNGNDPWLFNFREAWLRTLAHDYAGARRLCKSIMRAKAGYLTGQPEAIYRIASGYAELEHGNNDRAIEFFREVSDPRVTPKFFLHWTWRMAARLGASQVWLRSGELASCRREAEVYLESALATADPYLHALAWEMRSRISVAAGDRDDARKAIEQALAVLEAFEIPAVAWHVEATAWDVYSRTTDEELAEAHRARAEAHILAIANSFSRDEPLRQTFLAAAPVQQILAVQ